MGGGGVSSLHCGVQICYIQQQTKVGVEGGGISSLQCGVLLRTARQMLGVEEVGGKQSALCCYRYSNIQKGGAGDQQSATWNTNLLHTATDKRSGRGRGEEKKKAICTVRRGSVVYSNTRMKREQKEWSTLKGTDTAKGRVHRQSHRKTNSTRHSFFPPECQLLPRNIHFGFSIKSALFLSPTILPSSPPPPPPPTHTHVLFYFLNTVAKWNNTATHTLKPKGEATVRSKESKL